MRDISRRIQNYRLARYAQAERPRLPKWIWLALGVWALWAGLLSNHSFYQIWRLQRVSRHEQARLVETEDQLRHLDRQARDGNERKRIAERMLREQEGWSRPGEIIYRIDDKGTTAPPAQ
jgi:cell division protein FtsB